MEIEEQAAAARALAARLEKAIYKHVRHMTTQNVNTNI